jgi:hypothetical protein
MDKSSTLHSASCMRYSLANETNFDYGQVRLFKLTLRSGVFSDIEKLAALISIEQ